MSQYPYPRDSLEKIQARLLVSCPNSDSHSRHGEYTITRWDADELTPRESASVALCILEALGMELQRGYNGLEFVKA